MILHFPIDFIFIFIIVPICLILFFIPVVGYVTFAFIKKKTFTSNIQIDTLPAILLSILLATVISLIIFLTLTYILGYSAILTLL